MPKLKLHPNALEGIMYVLNHTSTKSVAEAAQELKVTRQALRNYMNANGIERVCEYRQTSRSIDIKSAASANTDPAMIATSDTDGGSR